MGNSFFFPGIDILQLEVREKAETPERGEFVRETTFPTISPDILENLRRKSGVYALVYTLKVDAVTESGARNRARAFVRMKNIFEPDFISVQDAKLMREGVATNDYEVVVEVTK